MAEGQTRAGAAAKSRSGMLIWLLLLLVVAAAGGYWFLRDSPAPAPANPTAIGSILHLDTFVLNLDDPDQKSYLRAGIELGLKRPAPAKAGESTPPLAPVRDTILSVLTTAKPDEILTPQGKLKLKTDLLRALQERCPELEVREVYFTEFLIQR